MEGESVILVRKVGIRITGRVVTGMGVSVMEREGAKEVATEDARVEIQVGKVEAAATDAMEARCRVKLVISTRYIVHAKEVLVQRVYATSSMERVYTVAWTASAHRNMSV